MRITFIGGGNMAAAIIAGLHAAGNRDLDIHVVDRNLDKGERFAREYGATFSVALTQADVATDVLVLAVKPQQLAELAAQITPWLQQQLVISVAAGVNTGKLASWLGGYRKLVWVMPNTPAQVGAGIAGAYATPAVSDAERAITTRLLSAVGQTIWLDDESRMNQLTAITGCGPAYVFLMVEALAAAAANFGFDAATAQQMAQGTFAGAIKLLEASGEAPADLRAKVTSKKGVTEQGILSLQSDDLFGVVQRAALRAEARAIEMGQQL